MQDLCAQSIIQVRRYNLQCLVAIQARVELQGLIRHIDARFLKCFLKAAQVLRDAVNERAFNIKDIAREHTGLVERRNIRGQRAKALQVPFAQRQGGGCAWPEPKCGGRVEAYSGGRNRGVSHSLKRLGAIGCGRVAVEYPVKVIVAYKLWQLVPRCPRDFIPAFAQFPLYELKTPGFVDIFLRR
jgi:hypothetical protein